MSEADGKVMAARLREKIRLREAELAILHAELTAVEARSLVEEPEKAQADGHESRLQDDVNGIPSSISFGNPLSFVPNRLMPDEYQRYGRQLILPEVGLQGQVKLRDARVLMVGVGGLGCPAAAYLAGAGVGTLGLIDADVVDASNLHRQILHATGRVGLSKVESAVQYLQELNPLVTYHKHVENLLPHTAIELFRRYDLILDCTDHPTSRYLISDACVITGKPLVSASALRVDGQLIVLNNPPAAPGNSKGGPCYRCIFPKAPPADSVVSCGDGGILGPVVGTMGVLQALEAIKLLCAKHDDSEAMDLPKAKMLMFSAYAEQQFRTVRMRSRRPDCAACSQHASVTEKSLQDGTMDYVRFCGATTPLTALDASLRVSPVDLARFASQDNVTVLDTRDATQFDICSLKSSINIPWTGDTSSWLKKVADDGRIDAARDIYLICRLGNDSQLAANALLQQAAFQQKHIRDVNGGLRAWRQQVDPTWPDY